MLEISGFTKVVVDLIGSPIIALSIGVLIAVYGLARKQSKKEISNAMEKGFQSVGFIILVTGAGGSLGYVVRDAGIGNALGETVLALSIPPVIIPFVLAALMRISLGSATVALLTAATLTSPLLAQTGLDPVVAAMSACAGGVSFSYFNDSGFWLFNGLYGLKDIKDQVLAKFVVSMIGSFSSLAAVIIMNFIFF
jgi:GntP family gluconate:H+ symporter